MNTVTKATRITAKTRKIVKERDGGCIFCRMNGESTGMNTQIMHFIPRSAGGLGIPENLAEGCILHHNMLDQGGWETRTQMLDSFRCYLKEHYEDWNEDKLKYRKYQ